MMSLDAIWPAAKTAAQVEAVLPSVEARLQLAGWPVPPTDILQASAAEVLAVVAAWHANQLLGGRHVAH